MKYVLKGSVHGENENVFFLAPTQRNWMYQIVVPFKAEMFSIICKLHLNGALHYTNIDCFQFLWAGTKEYKFIFAMRRFFNNRTDVILVATHVCKNV